MENPRPEKVAVVDEVRERLQSSQAVVLTEYRGLSVKAIAELRRQLRPNGCTYTIYKNTLVRRAASDLGIAGVEQLLTGPTAIAFVDGYVAGVAKSLRDFARTNNALVVKGGVLGGSVLGPEAVTALADLPPRDTLLAMLAGALASPMQTFAGLLQALPRNFAYGLKALIDKQGGAPEAPADVTEAPADVTEAPADVTEAPAGAPEDPAGGNEDPAA